MPASTTQADPAARRPVRVCLVAPSTDILGGQAVQAARLLANLRQAPGVEVDFVPVNPRLRGVPGRLQRVKYARTLVTQPAYLASLAARLGRCDVVHAFSASYLSFVLAPTPALLLGRLYGKKTIVNYRSGEADDHLRRWRTAAPTLRLADAVVVPSRYLVEVFARYGIRAHAIANVVEPGGAPPRRRASLRPVFLANRNLEPMYNVACVLRAFALVQARHPQARLTVAGDGSQRDGLESLAATLGLRGVRFAGRVDPAGMHALYDEADVYLNASDVDNAPASVLEAFARGLAVVTTDAGGIPYLVEHGQTGMMVACGDHAGLAAAALRLLDEPELAAALISRAQRECRARYHWDAVRDQWLALYRSLTGDPAHAGAAGGRAWTRSAA